MATEETNGEQTIYERAEIADQVVSQSKRLLANLPIEVIGHLDSKGLCCGNGTVAIVRVNLDEIVNPPT